MLLFLLGTEVIGMFGGWRTPRTGDSQATKMQPSLRDFFGAGAGGGDGGVMDIEYLDWPMGVVSWSRYGDQAAMFDQGSFHSQVSKYYCIQAVCLFIFSLLLATISFSHATYGWSNNYRMSTDKFHHVLTMKPVFSLVIMT